jgi:tetratricopeptide (TPR) repeat protein
VRSKALLLFSRRESAELEQTVKGLSGHPDQGKAAPYTNFINGLLAELRNDSYEAIEYYQQVLSEEDHPLVEDSLHQIVNLAISRNDTENAILALECLVGISPSYLLPYGEILRIVGRFEDAFNAYNRYLGFAPDDVGVMMKLGVMCKDAGLSEIACELFRSVLERDGNNSAARTLLKEVNVTSASMA